MSWITEVWEQRELERQKANFALGLRWMKELEMNDPCKPDNSQRWHKGTCACVSPERCECYAFRYFPGAMEEDGRSYCGCPCHDDYQTPDELAENDN